MSKPIEVTKIEINVRGKALSLTLDEMRELKDVLEKAFPTPKVTEKHVHHHDYYDHYPYRWPWYSGTSIPSFDHWKITCSTDGTAKLCVT